MGTILHPSLRAPQYLSEVVYYKNITLDRYLDSKVIGDLDGERDGESRPPCPACPLFKILNRKEIENISYVKTNRDGTRSHYASRRDCELRERLPYGRWLARDGREILFNRRYEPIWQRRPGEPATAANPAEWVSWAEQEWFFNDGCLPWNRHDAGRRSLARCQAILREWGVAS